MLNFVEDSFSAKRIDVLECCGEKGEKLFNSNGWEDGSIGKWRWLFGKSKRNGEGKSVCEEIINVAQVGDR